MKHSEKVTSLAAVLSAVLSVTCCLPLGIPVAIGLAGFGVLMSQLRPWFMALSVILLAVGPVQLYRRRACQRHNLFSLVIFCIAAGVVLALALFPQFVASILAD